MLMASRTTPARFESDGPAGFALARSLVVTRATCETALGKAAVVLPSKGRIVGLAPCPLLVDGDAHVAAHRRLGVVRDQARCSVQPVVAIAWGVPRLAGNAAMEARHTRGWGRSPVRRESAGCPAVAVADNDVRHISAGQSAIASNGQSLPLSVVHKETRTA